MSDTYENGEGSEFKVMDLDVGTITHPPSFDTELQILRHFFDAWDNFQTIMASQAGALKKQKAAQDLVQAADLVRNFRDPLTKPPANHG